MLIKKNLQSRPSRRAVLQAAGSCGFLGSMSMTSAFLNLQASAALANDSAPNDYKAVVCVFLRGGNDSFDMLAPIGTSTVDEYADYHTIRGTTTDGGIAIPQGDLLTIAGPDSRTFGLHPSFGADLTDAASASGGAGIQGLYNNSKLSFVANVGSIVQPTDRAAYDAKVNLPLGIFSHADLQRHWMTGIPQTRSQLKGWGGRMADLLVGLNDPSPISMNMSLNGANIFETGNIVSPYAIGTGGATPLSNYFKDPAQTTNIRYKAFSQIQNSVLGDTYENLLAQTLAKAHTTAIDAAIDFNTAVNSVPISTPFSDATLSKRMKKVAQVIKAREDLCQRRQVFFVEIGGFDNHTNLASRHPGLLTELSEAFSSFYQATVELGIEDDVVTFTASDFARTLTSNGAGSDHAWGGNHMIMGGPVNGGQIYGDYPTSLLFPVDSNGNTINTDYKPPAGTNPEPTIGRGRLIPTTSVDQYASEIAQWFGIPTGSLPDLFPNIGNFSGEDPLGMFA